MTGYSSVMWLDLEAPPQERWKLGLSTENPPAPHPPPPRSRQGPEASGAVNSA